MRALHDREGSVSKRGPSGRAASFEDESANVFAPLVLLAQLLSVHETSRLRSHPGSQPTVRGSGCASQRELPVCSLAIFTSAHVL